MTPKPVFSLAGYKQIADYARDAGYSIINFSGVAAGFAGKAILYRHDIDLSLERALTLARFEAEIGVQSTYFVLLSADVYNAASADSRKLLREIASLGHDVGLHWDSRTYPADKAGAERQFTVEMDMLSTILGEKVRFASQHYPALTPPIDFEHLVELESYSPKIQKRFKYVSDSSMAWREFTPYELIDQGIDIHFLSHPFWWTTSGKDQVEKYNEEATVISKRMTGIVHAERDGVMEFLANRAQHDAEFKKKRGW